MSGSRPVSESPSLPHLQIHHVDVAFVLRDRQIDLAIADGEVAVERQPARSPFLRNAKPRPDDVVIESRLTKSGRRDLVAKQTRVVGRGGVGVNPIQSNPGIALAALRAKTPTN